MDQELASMRACGPGVAWDASKSKTNIDEDAGNDQSEWKVTSVQWGLFKVS